MQEALVVRQETHIPAPPSAVFALLTDPDKIKSYIGSETITDWKPGSAIVWQGEMHGHKFQDKGTVLENQPGKLLRFKYWTGFAGAEDKPENYSTITYLLEKTDDAKTKFTYTRENIPLESEYQMFEAHLPGMLEAIKALAEN
jgi:uncharacterized protein YndB with AHSA1/START domain